MSKTTNTDLTGLTGDSVNHNSRADLNADLSDSRGDTSTSSVQRLSGLKPKLRFPEFQGVEDWEETQLGKISEVVRGGSPRPIDDFFTTDNDGLNWLKIGDVATDSKYITKTQQKVIHAALSKTREVHPGDLILSNSMSFGRPYILKIDACIHDGWIAITNLSGEINTDYLYYLISSDSCQNYFVNNAAGAVVQNLNADIIKLLPVVIPAPSEQQKIADCLTSLDELIAAERAQLAALKAYKKGLLQNLFPAEGESLPRLRFPEFQSAGEWEEKILESFCRIGDIDHKMPSSVADGIPYIMTGDFFEINDIDFHNAKKISAEDYEQLSKKIKPEFGDIIIARYASVGAVRYVETKIKFLVSYSCAIIKCNKSENSKYLYYIFQSDAIQSKIGLEINMSSQKNIGTDSIKKINICLPTLPEQQKIAELLTSIDEEIAGQSQRVAGLNVHKQGLLQGLFPVPEKT